MVSYDEKTLEIARAIWDFTDQYFLFNTYTYRQAFGMHPDEDDFEDGSICGFEMFHKITGHDWNHSLFRRLFGEKGSPSI